MLQPTSICPTMKSSNMKKIRARMTLKSLLKIRISLSTIVTKLVRIRLDRLVTHCLKVLIQIIQNSKSVTIINIIKIQVMPMMDILHRRNL